MKAWVSTLSHDIPKPRRIAFAEARGEAVPIAPMPSRDVTPIAFAGACSKCGYHTHAPTCPTIAKVAKAVVTGVKVTMDGKWTRDGVNDWFNCSLATWWLGKGSTGQLPGHALEMTPALCDACHAREFPVPAAFKWREPMGNEKKSYRVSILDGSLITVSRWEDGKYEWFKDGWTAGGCAGIHATEREAQQAAEAWLLANG